MKNIFGFVLIYCFLSTLFIDRANASIFQELASPIETNTSSLILGSGAALTLGIIAFGNSWEKRLTRDSTANDPLGHNLDKFGDRWGKLIPNIAYSGGMLVHYLITNNSQSGERSLLMFKATAYSGVIADITKLAVNERRPNGSKYSFPSGHATTSFAFASVVGAEHPWYYGATAYAIGVLVATSRLDTNMHYLHDVIAGAALGASYGVGLYAQAHRDTTSNPVSVQILPSDDLHGALISFQGSFSSFL